MIPLNNPGTVAPVTLPFMLKMFLKKNVEQHKSHQAQR